MQTAHLAELLAFTLEPDVVRGWGRLHAHFATRPLARRRVMHTLEAREEP